MQVDEKALEAAYEAGRDYVMDMDDRTKLMIRVCVRAYLSALGEQKPIAFVSKRVIDAFDVNGTEIVDAMLFPRGTLRPTEERPLYASPLPVMPITDEDVERAAKAIQATKINGQRVRFADAYAAMMARAALEAVGGRG